MRIEDIKYLWVHLPWAGVATAMVMLMLLSYAWHRHRKDTALERSLKRTINTLGKKSIQDAMLPDGIDGFVFVDHILLLPAGIFMFNLKNMPGYVFGAMKMDQWTQMLNNKSNYFRNPLYDLGEALRVVRAHLPDTRVEGQVVFWQTAKFPKGMPENVCMLSQLPEVLEQFQQEDEAEEVEQAWGKLVDLINKTREENQYDHRVTVYRA